MCIVMFEGNVITYVSRLGKFKNERFIHKFNLTCVKINRKTEDLGRCAEKRRSYVRFIVHNTTMQYISE